MSGPKTRRGSAEYNRTVSEAERRLDDRIKHHINAAENIEFRGNPAGAKFPSIAAALHRKMALQNAKLSNKSRANRYKAK